MPEWTTLKRMIWLLLLRGASAVIRTVTGTAPLVLENAVAAAIKSLKQYGKCTQPSGVWNTAITQYGLCEQNGTPTPDAPVDIVCNNGALRYGALGQNLLDPSAANTVLGYYINKMDGEVKSSPPNFLFANYMPVEAGKTYVAYGRAKSGNDLSDYNRVAWYDSNKGWLSGADYTQNRISVVTAPANAAYARFSCNPTGTTTTVVTQELVDSYNWMFAEGNAQITPFAPFEGGIYADGTPEVLTVHGENLITSTLAGYGTYVSPSSSAGNRAYKWLKDLPNGTYQFAVDGDYEIIVQWRNPADTSVIIPSAYENLSGWMTSGEVTLDKTSGGYGIAVKRTSGTSSITPSNFDGTLFCYKTSDIQTVTDIHMLLGVGDYKDEGEIISGLLTHKAGVKVLDGTETGWTQATTSTGVLRFYLPFDGAATPTGAREQVASTHFAYAAEGQDLGIAFLSTQTRVYFIPTDQTMTGTTWKAWLAEQYAAGTPVIVVYPLATETTEQTTAHPQLVNAKYNTASVTAAVSDIQVTFTTGEQTTPNPYSPLPIVCNNGELKWNGTTVVAEGTPEVLTVSGVNLCAPAYYTGEGWYVASSNQVAAASSNGTLVFPCKPNTTYSWWHTDGVGGGRAFELTTDTVTQGQEATWAVGNPAYNDAMTVRKYTTSADAKLLCILFARVDAERVGRTKEEQFADFMLVEGDITTATNYEPYVTPQSVTNLPMLLSVNDYKDEGEIISGIKTGKVGVKVFDGTETIGTSNACFTIAISDRVASRTALLCSHFPYSSKTSSQTDDCTIISFSSTNIGFRFDACADKTAFAAWLAAQYVAGTPIIVIYPLATENIENVTASVLTQLIGVNTVFTSTEVNGGHNIIYYGE